MCSSHHLEKSVFRGHTENDLRTVEERKGVSISAPKTHNAGKTANCLSQARTQNRGELGKTLTEPILEEHPRHRLRFSWMSRDEQRILRRAIRAVRGQRFWRIAPRSQRLVVSWERLGKTVYKTAEPMGHIVPHDVGIGAMERKLRWAYCCG